MAVTVKDMPLHLRPREKAMSLGFGALSDSELLALIISSGIPGTNSIALANDILVRTDGIGGLMKMSLQQLMQLKGIGLAKASQILASLELIRRMSYVNMINSDVMSDPRMLVTWLQKTYGSRDQEYFVAVFLNSRGQVKGYRELFIGTAEQVTVEAKELFNEAIRCNASRMIIAHNHPSQITEPSRADVSMTLNLHQAGEIMGISLVDHVIVSYDRYYSFRENGRI